jgi:hypothetical protein
VSGLTAQVGELQAQLTALTGELEEARAGERAAAGEAADATAKLAAAAAREGAMQEAYDALLARITPHQTPAPDEPTNQSAAPEQGTPKAAAGPDEGQ